MNLLIYVVHYDISIHVYRVFWPYSLFLVPHISSDPLPPNCPSSTFMSYVFVTMILWLPEGTWVKVVYRNMDTCPVATPKKTFLPSTSATAKVSILKERWEDIILSSPWQDTDGPNLVLPVSASRMSQLCHALKSASHTRLLTSSGSYVHSVPSSKCSLSIGVVCDTDGWAHQSFILDTLTSQESLWLLLTSVKRTFSDQSRQKH